MTKLRRLCRILIIILIAVLPAELSAASKLQKYNQEIESARTYEFTVKQQHPRIMIQEDRLPEIRSWVAKQKWKYGTLYNKLIKTRNYSFLFALGDSGVFVEVLKKNAIDSFNTIGRRAAIQLLEETKQTFDFRFSNTYRASRIDKRDRFALKYDWTYAALTAKERQQIVDHVIPRISYEKFHFDWKAKMGGYREGSGNTPGIITGLAFYENLSTAQRRSFHEYVSNWLSDLRAMNHRSGKSGGWGISLSYGVGHANACAVNLFALETATVDGNFFERFGSSFINFGFAYAQLMLPSNSWVRYGDIIPSSFFTPLCRWPRMQPLLAADFLRRQGKTARALLTVWALENACGRRPGDRQIPYVIDPIEILMSSDPEFRLDSPKRLDLPLAVALGWDEEKGEIESYDGKKAGIGVVVMRSAWDDPMATHATFRSMPLIYPVHYSPGELTFGITKGEELALPYSGEYFPHFEGGPWNSQNPGWPHHGHYFHKALATNTLLVYDPEENFEGWNNDGGQRTWKGVPGIWWYGSCRNGNPLDSGGLTGFEQSQEYVWTAGDATRAYSSTLPMSSDPKNRPKVSLVQRDFVYLRSDDGWRDFFIIFDRVAAVNPNFKKVWLLHTQARPELDGKSTVTVGNDIAGIFRSYNSSLVTITQDRSRLFSKTLLPKEGEFFIRYLGGQAKTRLTKPLSIDMVQASHMRPIDIEVETTDALPKHPVVIIHHDPQEYSRGDTMDRFSTRPWSESRPPRIETTRNCYFCEDKTPPGQKPAKLLKCRRAVKASKPHPQTVGSWVIQGFRFMGMEGTDIGDDAQRLDYPQAYGAAYTEFRGWDGLLYGMWRVEIEVTKKEEFNNFLHVLHPAQPNGVMPPCSLVESREGTAYGALVDNKLVLFGKKPAAGWRQDPDTITRMEPLEHASYEVVFRGDLSQLVVNLVPQTNYIITQNEKILFRKKSSSQGIIHFTSTVEGQTFFRLSISDTP